MVVLMLMLVVMIPMVMVVVMASASLAMLVVVLMLVVMIMMVLVTVIVVMVVAVAFHVLVELVVEPGVVDRMEHPVPELVLVHIQDGAHECEADLLHGLEGAVVLHAVLDVGEVQGDAVAVFIDDGGLDVAQEASGLLGDPLADGQQGLGHPGLGVRVPSGDRSLEALGASARDLEGRMLVLVLMVVIVAAAFAVRSVLVMLAHLIISYSLSMSSSVLAETENTGLPGNSLLIHPVTSSI